jgi:hypothetical protein
MKHRKAMEEVLDSCLLNDKEFGVYEEAARKNDQEALKKLYFSSNSSK